MVDREPSAALHEDLLGGVVDEALGDDLVGTPALAGSEVLIALVVGAHGAADHHGREHEREPPEERELAVAGAPPPGPGCEVALLRHDRSFACVFGCSRPRRYASCGG